MDWVFVFILAGGAAHVLSFMALNGTASWPQLCYSMSIRKQPLICIGSSTLKEA